MSYETCMCEGCKIYRKEKGIPEPDPNAAYNAKVREIAEELVNNFPESRDRLATIPTIYKSQYMRHELIEVVVNDHMEQARAMVSKIANEFSEGYHEAMKDQGFSRYESDPDLKQHLIERGLTPAKPENNARSKS